MTDKISKNISDKQLSEINFSAVVYKNYMDFIPFKEYKVQYIISLVGFIVGFIFLPNIGFFLAVPIIAYFTKQIQAKKTAAINNFANDNGWRIGNESEIVIPPSLRGIGRSEKVKNIIIGSFNTQQFILYDFTYDIVQGRSKKTVEATVFGVQLHKTLPYVLLDSRRAFGAGRVHENATKIELEGDFNSYFTLYATPSSRIDALSFITPDIMQTLKSYSNNYDIEFNRNSIYLFCNGDQRNAEKLTELFKAAEKVLSEVNHKLKTYNYSVDEPVVYTNNTAVETFQTVQIDNNPTTIKWIFIIIFIVIFIIALIPFFINCFSIQRQIGF